jgi:spore maturation protein CgeB
MGNSIVREAAKAFSEGNYSKALGLYQQLGGLLGHHNFRANIAITEKRLQRSRGRRDCAALSSKEIKIACVMDEFTFHSYDPECTLLQLSPDHALDELEAFNPDLLFIESAWRGKDELWNRKIGSLSGELKAVIQWCKQRNIPTVFWNKEDPVHFETFLTTAQQFDYVFTTDIDCIARYKQALGHDRVFLLPFACQPKTHNPIELYPRKDAFCFAGAYYVRYPERTRDLETYVAEFPKFKPLEIFDRNFGKDDVNYQFPPEYQPYIVGTLPFNEIDKAYKGYRYAINLNSIKQSQSMFARRVYELLGSNTITVSNFSRGVRLLFGDLVITSDSGKEIIERLQRLSEEDEQKLRLAGLRKVMLEHTYEHRLAYVLSKSLGRPMRTSLPTMLVIAVADSPDDCSKVLENFQRQLYREKRLLLVAEPQHRPEGHVMSHDEAITFVKTIEQANAKIFGLTDASAWLAPMVPADYYGPNYLLDLALASRYSEASLVGKVAHYQFAGTIHLVAADRAYRSAPQIAQRCSAIRLTAIPQIIRTDPVWLRQLAQANWQQPGLALDPFNYCRNGMQAEDLAAIAKRVDDLDLDTGLSCEQLLSIAENIEAAKQLDSNVPRWTGQRLLNGISCRDPQISFTVDESGLQIRSNLPDGKHQYLYSIHDLSLETLPVTQELKTHLETTPGLDVRYVFVFLDVTKKKISHAILTANRNHTTAIPEGATYVRFGWRVMGNGTCTVKSLLWGHRNLDPAQIIGRGEHLVLLNHYPAYDDLYRNGFVHSRVVAYAKRDVKVDVFRLRSGEAISYHEFQNVDVITGSAEALDTLLKTGRYRSVLVHFLNESMWKVLQHHIETTRVLVWVHGAEIQPWHRRDYDFTNDAEREAAKAQSEIRMRFWRSLLAEIPKNLKLVFVSRYFAEEVMEDLGFRLPEHAYTIIHNPIDTELFSYQPKPAEQRKKILKSRFSMSSSSG